jgi:uncharacterized protein (DUF1330 family)
MTNLLARAINCDDADRAARIINAESLLGSHLSSVSDPQKLAAYAKPRPRLLVRAFLLAATPAVAQEHGVEERAVITEYPSLEKATASYGSPAYQEALKALGDGAVRDVRIIEGLE